MLDHNLFRYLPESRKVNHPVPGVDDHPTRHETSRSVFLRLCSWLFDNPCPAGGRLLFGPLDRWLLPVSVTLTPALPGASTMRLPLRRPLP